MREAKPVSAESASLRSGPVSAERPDADGAASRVCVWSMRQRLSYKRKCYIATHRASGGAERAALVACTSHHQHHGQVPLLKSKQQRHLLIRQADTSQYRVSTSHDYEGITAALAKKIKRRAVKLKGQPLLLSRSPPDGEPVHAGCGRSTAFDARTACSRPCPLECTAKVAL